jgi:hypothetical protein
MVYAGIVVGVILVYFSFFAVVGAPASDGDSPTKEAQQLVDMHTHTTESDGDTPAEELIANARKIGVRELWITDHDIIRSLDRVKVLQQVAVHENVNLGFGQCNVLAVEACHSCAFARFHPLYPSRVCACAWVGLSESLQAWR